MERFPNFEQYQASASYAQIGEHKIAYWTAQDAVAVENDEPWVLLIHGFPSAAWDWHNQWPELIKHFKVFTLDMLGFGFSDKPRDIHYKITTQADLLTHFMRLFKVNSVQILSHDYGDTVAQELLARSNLNVKHTNPFYYKNCC